MLRLTPQNNNLDMNTLDHQIATRFDDEVRFLQALVRIPTDTPPGNNAPPAPATTR